MKKLYYTSFFYAVLGLLAGVFYREATRHNGFTGETALAPLHTHILVLGFMFFLVVLGLGKLFGVHEAKSFGTWHVVYNLGLLITIGTMAVRGMLQVHDSDIAFLPYIAGLGHMILGAGIIWLLVLLGKRID
ncbi:MAG: DUF2871 domain-containing protein [Paenibacillus macerans]|uniref:DUF2871 family protein n=1 Tax=Paenibacillus macerans TaxID=44252 RepID=A0A090YA82_PAEMA|nr:DUF2871 domain-containing protein [Paenibacillus macerans]KFM95394.1 hypothetical protein DJ90_5492 [Paenibacillus macerans]MBS5915069.1 DUF2871 domain-containing protein [Paenibacillus macerans]MCY7558026.1 DUF2871 domain-containing protein [Paenibacillus macerans]MDU5948352.1 DUF2871 domain-containing protein [Paenibacillus macerans]MDU7477624.1 DUF2871 domain-containing protein [Paenibacillus macerans]